MEFDEQWKHLISEKFLHERNRFELTQKRIDEFLSDIKINKNFDSSKLIRNKTCLDAGCGIGRWTWVMMKLGPSKLDSFDISSEAVDVTKKLNPNTRIFDILNLKSNPVYDFVLSWNAIHHTKNPKLAFLKLSSQVKSKGWLTIRVYNKENDNIFEEGRKMFKHFSFDEKINFCLEKVKTEGGDIHGWFDIFNPEYNWSFSPDEITDWFYQEGFSEIMHIPIKSKWTPNINVIACKNE
jgi:2-polyprenyl-3-methyl-5-hydroxy-6-metoxy-1,4-benzoquinol methylase